MLIDGLLARRREAAGPRSRGDGQRPPASTATGWSTATRRDEALEGADALAIVTEWKHFVNPDFDEMRRLMRQPVIFDGRNLYRPRADEEGRLHLLQHRPAGGVRR